MNRFNLEIIMDKYERIGYGVLALATVLYLAGLIVGMVTIFPLGLIGLFVLFAFGTLALKVLKERLANKEDDYYSNGVDK